MKKIRERLINFSSNLVVFFLATIVISVSIYYVLIPVIIFSSESERLVKFLSELNFEEIYISTLLANAIVYQSR